MWCQYNHWKKNSCNLDGEGDGKGALANIFLALCNGLKEVQPFPYTNFRIYKIIDNVGRPWSIKKLCFSGGICTDTYTNANDHGTVGAVPLIYTNAELYDHKRKHIIFDNMKGCMKQHPISEKMKSGYNRDKLNFIGLWGIGRFDDAIWTFSAHCFR